MLKKFAWWFICFGLSFLVSDVFGWTDQGRAFLYIKLGASVILVAVIALIFLIAGIAIKEKIIGFIGTGISIFAMMAVILITLFATWGATKLFDVDFFVTYQIMTFGACLVSSSSSKSSDDD